MAVKGAFDGEQEQQCTVFVAKIIWELGASCSYNSSTSSEVLAALGYEVARWWVGTVNSVVACLMYQVGEVSCGDGSYRGARWFKYKYSWTAIAGSTAAQPRVPIHNQVGR